MLKLVYQSKTAESMALISDAIKPTGLGDGEYRVWGEKIAVNGGRTSLVEGPSQGTIAGSVITMREALSNIASIGVPLKEAIKMATHVPAQAAGLERDYGSIGEGRRADLFALDDEFNVKFALAGNSFSMFDR
jgi:N-acetylglucosamine-6-phosphate deacetylase